MNDIVHSSPDCLDVLPRRAVLSWPVGCCMNGWTANWWRAFKTGLARAGSNPWQTWSNCSRKKKLFRKASISFCSSAAGGCSGGALTAALYVPIAGFAPAFSFNGDLVVALYMLSLLTLCLGLAGANTVDRFSLIGATRTLTQLFSYEAPFLLALLGPAIAAGTWQISQVNDFAAQQLVDDADPADWFFGCAGGVDG